MKVVSLLVVLALAVVGITGANIEVPDEAA